MPKFWKSAQDKALPLARGFIQKAVDTLEQAQQGSGLYSVYGQNQRNYLTQGYSNGQPSTQGMSYSIPPPSNAPIYSGTSNEPTQNMRQNGPTQSSGASTRKGKFLPHDVLAHIPTRAHSGRAKLGAKAVSEARKGLSRVLDATDENDIQRFGEQLRQSDRTAVELNWASEDRLPTFAISYVQQNPAVGRFKFKNEEWENLCAAVKELASCGVTKFRIWLDQCLWLQDASQESWAHTGLLPYVLWPVISLGTKRAGAERTIATETRMWPFIEEVAALWGLGLIITKEMRGKDMSGGARRWFSYKVRIRLEPEMCMAMLLLNIFHGAVDGLETGWVDDVNELKEMAKFNMFAKGETIFVGSDWRERVNVAEQRGAYMAVMDSAFPCESILGGVNVYIEQSRTVVSEGWHGLKEWLSGLDVPPGMGDHDIEMLEIVMEKYNVITDQGEFQLLRLGAVNRALWLLVAMDGPSSYFSRGKVLWTKVLVGLSSCQLGQAIEIGSVMSIQWILSEQLNRKIKIKTIQKTNNDIQWT